ncbi:hypothetical protein KL953_20505 [Mycolicibacterium goodii]|nr:hypothetical protein [Mycolicibacterium goodii]
MLYRMRNHLRSLIIGVGAMVALGTMSACSSGTTTESATSATTTPAATTAATPSEAPAPLPQSIRYMADMPTPDGKTMSIGISVDGDMVTAYACNGVDDESWFFGNQSDGDIDITSKFRDTLKADMTADDAKGELTMNGVNYTFTAMPVSEPAGMYTAAFEGVRASWIVHPDGSVTGVQFNGGITGRDFEQAELQQLNAQQFQSQVRNKRQLQQAQQLIRLQNGTFRSTINGHEVTPELVTGKTRFG